MNRATEQLLEEIAPVIQELVVREAMAAATKAVDARIRTGDLVVSTWHRAHVPGRAYAAGAIVEAGPRLFRATTATAEAPTLEASDWVVLADVAH